MSAELHVELGLQPVECYVEKSCVAMSKRIVSPRDRHDVQRNLPWYNCPSLVGIWTGTFSGTGRKETAARQTHEQREDLECYRRAVSEQNKHI
jgi:hypothetical protein